MVIGTSTAAAFNRAILKKLQAPVENDPDINLLSKIPMEYSERLASRKLDEELPANPLEPEPKRLRTESNGLEPNIWSYVKSSDIPRIIYPFSPSAESLLTKVGGEGSLEKGIDAATSPLLKALMILTEQGEVVWQDRQNPSKMVFKCGETLAVKVVQGL